MYDINSGFIGLPSISVFGASHDTVTSPMFSVSTADADCTGPALFMPTYSLVLLMAPSPSAFSAITLYVYNPFSSTLSVNDSSLVSPSVKTFTSLSLRKIFILVSSVLFPSMLFALGVIVMVALSAPFASAVAVKGCSAGAVSKAPFPTLRLSM